MKRLILLALMMGAAGLLSSCASHDHGQPQTAVVGEPGSQVGEVREFDSWPLRFDDEGTDFTIFEPQVDSWNGHELAARCAMAVQGPNDTEARYGVFTFSTITLVDKSDRKATLANFRVTSADFPSARNQTEIYVAMLTQSFPAHVPALSLDRLETALAAPAPPKEDHLNNTPPKVIIATQPAVLVYIDGPPAWRAVAGTDFQRVINTRMLVLRDSSGRCYLRVFDGYLEAASLDGPWTVASQPPAGIAAVEQAVTDSGQVDLMTAGPGTENEKAPSLKTGTPPDVFVATSPTELIQFQGQPEYVPIPGTGLLYASNTSANVFKLVSDQENYLLISGRWYRSSSLDGSWQFMPGSQLPPDFANIPDSSAKENVKASVPGTQQANEALIANSIPQSTAIARDNQMSVPNIDGAAQLAPIEGTSLYYVANSATPIIEVNAQSWYACQDGAWYQAPSANGPWAVATSIPAVIYTIPADSPLHYVTYVQIYGTSPQTVYEGYTPGYMGTEVAEDGTVVYGTGYDYSPWIGAAWYGPPITWGWGFYDCWSPWWGWGYGCGFGWGWGWAFFPPYPYWCGFRHHDFDHWHDHGAWHRDGRGTWANTSANVYHTQGRVAAFNRSRNLDGYGRAYNSRTGWLQAGQHANVQNAGGAAWQRKVAFNDGVFRSHAAGSFGGWNGHSSRSAARPEGINRSYHGYQQGRGWNGPHRSGPAGVSHGYHGGGHGGGGGFHGGGGGGGGGHGGR